MPVSKPSLKKLPLVDEELLELEELEELLLEEELLELEELEEVPEEEELELLLEEELLELEELEELLLEVSSPVQVGAIKLPSWLPWKPKAPTVPLGGGNCHVHPSQLVN